MAELELLCVPTHLQIIIDIVDAIVEFGGVILDLKISYALLNL